MVGAVVELARKAENARPMIDVIYALTAERAKHLDRYAAAARLCAPTSMLRWRALIARSGFRDARRRKKAV
jgi:hypothetical protein